MKAKIDVLEYIFSGLEKNVYLVSLYTDLLNDYSCKTLGIQQNMHQIKIEDALRFADVLSQSIDPEKRDLHRMIAQEMIVMLHELYPDNGLINITSKNVLINLGNFPGLAIDASISKAPLDFLSNLFEAYGKERFASPNADDKVFSNTQKEIFERLNDRVFSFSGPTSMGKSFLIQEYIKGGVEKGEQINYAIILPTKALINEVSDSMTEALGNNLQSKNYRVVTSANALAVEEDHNFIFVLTPERLLYLQMSRPDIKIGFAFIDEAQNINNLDGRSSFYFKTIATLAEQEDTKIIFASPYNPNPEIYLEAVKSDAADTQAPQSKSMVINQSPVSQFKFFVNLKTGKMFSYNEIKEKFQFEDQLPQGTTLNNLILRFSDPRKPEGKSSLIYCNSKHKALLYSKQFVDCLQSPLNDPELDRFSKEIANEISPQFCLATFVKYGVGLHLGYLPSSIRKKMELLFQSRKLKVIFCTSTLLEGVNLPADNLFLASDHKFNRLLHPLEFKNLVGRAGRIRYSLYGNVIGVLQGDVKNETEQQFENLYQSKPEEQHLSLQILITKDVADQIIRILLSGKSKVTKNDFNLEEDKLDLLRKATNALLGDILHKRETYIVRLFRERRALSPEKEEQIRTAFIKKRDLISDDINIDLEQSTRLSDAISNGLKYPNLIHDPDAEHLELDPYDYEETLEFLQELSMVFEWKEYDPSLVNGRVLEYYTSLLLDWMEGWGLSWIVSKTLERTQTVFIDRKPVFFEKENDDHVNHVIANLLDDIQRVLLFSFSNYFLKFSTEYKKQHGSDSLNDNDWYSFVEFGSMNWKPILLQKMGYSRESALFLLDDKTKDENGLTNRSKYLVISNSIIYIKKSVLSCGNLGVQKESQTVQANFPDRFVE